MSSPVSLVVNIKEKTTAADSDTAVTAAAAVILAAGILGRIALFRLHTVTSPSRQLMRDSSPGLALPNVHPLPRYVSIHHSFVVPLF